MSDVNQPQVTRTVDLDATVDEVWTALTDDRERSAWFGGDSRIDIRPGGAGEVVDPDGSVHRVEVAAVEPGRRLEWRWAPLSGGVATDVEFVVEALPEGARLTVTERRVGLATGPQASAASTVVGRLLDLELLFVGRRSAACFAERGSAKSLARSRV